MTYVELIVVLSIFATMVSITMFNYSSFRARIDLRNLSNDIALKIVQAQKYSMNGELPPLLQQSDIANLTGGINNWKPSYGVYFNTSTPYVLVYFTDIDSDKIYDSGNEFLEELSINNGSKISQVSADCGGTESMFSSMAIVFQRPNSGATFTGNETPTAGCKYAKIKISSSQASVGDTEITVNASGKIETK